MQFYKIEGCITNKNWASENKNWEIRDERIAEIAMNTSVFNQDLKAKACFHVIDAKSNRIIVAAIVEELANFNKTLKSFLKAVGLNLTGIRIEEVTLNTITDLMRKSERTGYIEDAEDIMDRFDLGEFTGYGRHISFYEAIARGLNKEEIYAESTTLLETNTFIPELDRIFSLPKKKLIYGHPVHYMIQTDDLDTREKMQNLLIESLYLQGRLRNKRYCIKHCDPTTRIDRYTLNKLYKSSIGGCMIIEYMINNEGEDGYASTGRDAIEIVSEIARKYCNQVLTVFSFHRECTKARELFYEYLGGMTFIELKEDFAYEDASKRYLNALAKERKVRTDKRLLSMVERDKGYLSAELHKLFDEWYNEKLKTKLYPQYKDMCAARREILEAKPKGSAFDELMDMVGVEGAKKVINQALSYSKAQKVFAEKGMQVEQQSLHMVFTGNPGTAKTTVARLFAKIMQENGILSKGHIVEVGRGDLVGRFVGWTAPIIQNKFKAAKGGVLFIDEAYSLVDDRDGSFGDEAINTIVQEMENHRDEVVVIFAGYPDKMEAFLQKNPGLRSRVIFHVNFDDYSTDELCEIADLISSKKGLKLTAEAADKLRGIFGTARNENDFGNGRYVRNVIEKAKMQQANRLLSLDYEKIKSEDVITIQAEDIDIPHATKNSKMKKIGFLAESNSGGDAA